MYNFQLILIYILDVRVSKKVKQIWHDTQLTQTYIDEVL